MSNNLKTKDLVTLGIFFIIYFIVAAIIATSGIIPIMFLIYPTISAIVCGPILMLFMAKVPKKWALFIFGMINPVIMWATGHTYVIPLVALIFVGLAELVFRKGGFKSFKYNTLAYALFSTWTVAGILQILLIWDKYEQLGLERGMSAEYLAMMREMVSFPIALLVAIGAFVGGILGAYLGKFMLKKHFEKAGIV